MKAPAYSMSDLCWVCQKNNMAIMRAANTPEVEKSQVRPHQINYLFLVSGGSLFVEFSKKNKLVGVVIFMGGAHALCGLCNVRGR